MYLSSYSIMVEKEIEIESPDEFQARGFVEVLEMAVWVASEKWSLRIFITNLNTICDLFTIVWTDKSELMASILEVLENRSSF